MTAQPGGPNAVVFDVGHVLIDWRPHYLFRSFFDDDDEIDGFLAEIGFDAWNLDLDRGRDWAEAVDDLATRHPHHAAPIRAFHERWEETIGGPIEGTVDILHSLRNDGVPVYAITNFAAPTFELTRKRFDFMNLFRDTVVSGIEQVIKPDPAIYNILIERQALQAADLVFVDDRLENVEGARAVGMHAVHFQNPEGLRDELVGLGFSKLAS